MDTKERLKILRTKAAEGRCWTSAYHVELLDIFIDTYQQPEEKPDPNNPWVLDFEQLRYNLDQANERITALKQQNAELEEQISTLIKAEADSYDDLHRDFYTLRQERDSWKSIAGKWEVRAKNAEAKLRK